MKILTKIKNKLKRLPRKIGAWLIVKSAEPEMDRFGWKRFRWHEDVNGMILVYYVCKKFPKFGAMPPGDNCIRINDCNGPRCNASQEANQPSRRSDSSTVEDIQTVQHLSPNETRVRLDRKAQDQDHDTLHTHKHHYPSQC